MNVTWCFIPTFGEIGHPVFEMKISEGYFTIYGHGGHLSYVTQMPCTNYCSPYQMRLHKKFGFH